MQNANTQKEDAYYQNWLKLGNKGTFEDFMRRKELWQPVAPLVITKE